MNIATWKNLGRTITCAMMMTLIFIVMTQPSSACQYNGADCKGSVPGAPYFDSYFKNMPAPATPAQTGYGTEYYRSLRYFADGGTFVNYDTGIKLSATYVEEKLTDNYTTSWMVLYVKPPCRLYNTADKQTVTLIPPTGKRFTGWLIFRDTFGDRFPAPLGVNINELLPRPYAGYWLWPVWEDGLSITYQPNGGVGQAFSDSSGTDNKVIIKGSTFTRTDFIFNGWNTKPDGTGTTYQVGDQVTLSGNSVVYAQWRPKEYTITYVYDWSGSSIDDAMIPYASYTIRGYMGVAAQGYVFKAWSTLPNGAGTVYNPGQIITATGDLKLYAQLVYASTIVYSPNGATGNAYSDLGNDGLFYIKGSLFTRENYKFLGWSLNPAGGFVLPEGFLISGLSGSLILYAQWEYQAPPELGFSVTYNPGLGIGTPYKEYANSSDQITLPLCSFTRQGFVFVGWNVKADESGQWYFPNDTITLTESINLYAGWFPVAFL